MLGKYFSTNVNPFFIQRFLRWLSVVILDIVLKLAINYDGYSLFFGNRNFDRFLRWYLLNLFLTFFVFAGMEERKWGIEPVALARSNKVIHIQLVCIFTTCASVEVQLLYLNLAVDWKGVGEAFSSSIDWSNLCKQVLQLVD